MGTGVVRVGIWGETVCDKLLIGESTWELELLEWGSGGYCDKLLVGSSGELT